jgi:hypothetical protein
MRLLLITSKTHHNVIDLFYFVEASADTTRRETLFKLSNTVFEQWEHGALLF